MNRPIGVMLAVVLAASGALIAGCGQPKPSASAAVNEKSRQLLVEGTVFLKQGEVVKAVQGFAGAIKESPDYFEAYYMLGETFLHLKQFDQARAVLTAAANRFPENPVVFYLLSAAYEGSGNMMPAIVAARKSLDLFQAAKAEAGVRRATVLLGALVQAAKEKDEAGMVANAAKDAAKAAPAAPASVQP